MESTRDFNARLVEIDNVNQERIEMFGQLH